jgi:hypothetical protein
LLVAYVQATLLGRKMARNPSNVAVWEKAVRVQLALAARLRLAPQSRVDPKTIGRQQQQRVGPAPWDNINRA